MEGDLVLLEEELGEIWGRMGGLMGEDVGGENK